MAETFSWPNEEIRHAGYSLLGEFQNGLFSEMEKILEPLYGTDWFQKCLTHEKWAGKKHEKDLSVLLKETVQFANQNFRMAIAKSILNEQSLTKKDIDSLEIILDYRHLWSHESSEDAKRITQLDLRDLAANIKKFAMNDSVRISCDNAVEIKDVADLIFSLPVVARHLPENIKSKEQIQKISAYLQESSGLKASGPISSDTESQELLKIAVHGWKKAELKSDYLNIKYRLLELRILNKIYIDANQLVSEFFTSRDFDEEFSTLRKYEYLHGDFWSEISDELSLLSDDIHKIFNETLMEVNSDIAELGMEAEKYTQIAEVDRCDCATCKLSGFFMDPFDEKDSARNEFIESRIFNRNMGVRFIKLFVENEQT